MTPLKVILLLCSLLAAASTVAAQDQCAKKLDELPQPPELRGFRLGMRYDEVKARVPQIRLGQADRFGVAKTTINPDFDPSFDKSSFEGVRSVSLDFLDNKLVVLWIGYDHSFKWQTLEDFIAGMSKALNVPGAWQPKRLGRQLTCDGLSLFALIVAGSPSLRLTDETAQETIGSRREEAAAAEEGAESESPKTPKGIDLRSLVIGDQSRKLYYPLDCPAAAEVSETTRVLFKNKEEAEKAGYKQAKKCK